MEYQGYWTKKTGENKAKSESETKGFVFEVINWGDGGGEGTINSEIGE